jgi:hypothetical protein
MLQYVEKRMKLFSRVAWPDMGGQGSYMDVVSIDKVEVLKNKFGPSKASSSQYGSR